MIAKSVSGESAIWLDGLRSQALPLPDRGLDFGDGLFETLLLHEGKLLFRELHLKRLQRGLQALYFPNCTDSVGLQLQRAADAVRDWGWRWSALRVTVSRGAGPRGYAPPVEAIPRIIITASDLGSSHGEMSPPARLSLASVRWSSQPALAGLKHINRLEQVLAAREYRLAGMDEAVMLDQAGMVVSVTAGNLFVASEGRLLTAPIEDCGIAGTRRDLIMHRWAPALGLKCEEVTLTPRQLESADEVFLSNSLVGPRPVAGFGQRRWASHDICEALYRQYRGDIA